jgi:hypothetical protein
VDQHDLGAATSAVTFMRTMGGAFGAAVFGAVLKARLTVELARHLPAGARRGIAPTRLQGSPAQIDSLPPAVRAGVIEAFEASLRTTFLVAVPITLAAFAVVWWLRELPLRERAPVGETVADSLGAAEPAL